MNRLRSMSSRRRASALLLAAGVVLGSIAALTASAAAAPAAAGSAGVHTAAAQPQFVRACGQTQLPNAARCDAILVRQANRADAGDARADRTDRLEPYLTSDLRAAYHLPSAGQRTTRTIAVVDAYDDPTAAEDLAVYRQRNHLPPCSSSPCFRKINQRGATTYPPTDPGWALEISLDLDMVSSACPGCRILLVEADTNQIPDLGSAVNQAVASGAAAVSNSYGAPEYRGEVRDLRRYFTHPDTLITASTGDFGYGVEFPSVGTHVLAVGGTTLYRDARGGYTEAGWDGAGSGCSAYVEKPAWQHDSLCGKRVVADLSAVADPNTPVAVYDTTQVPGWVDVGGTSAAAPLVAALLGGTAAPAQYADAYFYQHSSALTDVVTGPPNGPCDSYLCTPTVGYDGPTGLGSPLLRGAPSPTSTRPDWSHT